jgi:aspartyl-tRNA synthetase
MTYAEAMEKYGSDKPDIRFGMEFKNLNEAAKNKGFKIFDEAELVVGIVAEQCAVYSRKQLDALTKWVQRPQIGAKGLVYVKYNEDGTFKSSVDKFYSQEDLKSWAETTGAKPGDLVCVLSGDTNKVRAQLSAFRMEMAERLGLRKADEFAPLWVVDFPLLEWDEEGKRFHAMHHPFTSPKEEDIDLLETDPGAVRANAYDLAMNGVELGGGSIRIHNKELQAKMFKHLGFTDEEAKKQFGFLMDAFEYGAPPHGGIALGLDRIVMIMAGAGSLRDVIAFPKNQKAQSTMDGSPDTVDEKQLRELHIKLRDNN